MDQPHPHASYTQPEGLWDARDVCKFLKTSRSWVYHQAEAGKLPSIKLGGLLRFVPADIRNFVKDAGSGSRTVIPLVKPER
jgi:excisionase family DNA binding protein